MRTREAFSKLRLRTQLLLVVNTIVGVAALGMLYLDYRASIENAIDRTTASLADEARTIAHAADALEHHGTAAVQEYLDAVCAAMDARSSPGHEIDARLVPSGIELSSSHTHPVTHIGERRISGTAEEAGAVVTVSEFVSPIFVNARAGALRRGGALLGGAGFAALLVNLLLIHLVSRPLEELVHKVRSYNASKAPPTLPPSANAELEVLSAELGAMMHDLDRRERDRDAQLSRARRLQAHLMTGETLTSAVAIEYHPADQIAGDYVEVLELKGGDRLYCLADVVGHGVPAAMGAAVIKALVVSLDASDLSPASVLKSLNTGIFKASLPEDFATMIVVRVPAHGGPVLYASAGHEICYVLCSGGRVSELSSTGMVLGVDPTAEFYNVELDLDAGDVLVLMSDGLSEAMNRDGQQLGRAAILKMLSELTRPEAKTAAQGVFESALQHLDGRVADDDMTVVAVAISTTSQPQEAF